MASATTASVPPDNLAELLERLAVLTPRPRVNLILYDGVLAPRAAWRAALVPTAACGIEASPAGRSVEADEDENRGGRSHPRCLSMGRADAADVRIRRPGLSALWRTVIRAVVNGKGSRAENGRYANARRP